MFKFSIFLFVLAAVASVIRADYSDPACEQPIVTGPCKAYFRVYGYNKTTDKCERFTYGGCQGNDNRFDTLEEPGRL
ncbi:hypothetical protein ABMA28_011243 [Loxostege sticticalis]|uniref:BPTI/Kunitz inhibitor domain-containing protein n=1 Tax=Loxostege sticticalis TaxID=481309 RepID=A0ABD0S6T9_LOXSC